jgi:hypothetical protein
LQQICGVIDGTHIPLSWNQISKSHLLLHIFIIEIIFTV